MEYEHIEPQTFHSYMCEQAKPKPKEKPREGDGRHSDKREHPNNNWGRHEPIRERPADRNRGWKPWKKKARLP